MATTTSSLDQCNDTAQRRLRLPSTGDSLTDYHLQKLETPPTRVWQSNGGSVSAILPPHQQSNTMHAEHSWQSSSTRPDSSTRSLPRRKSKTLFSGPPPPIAASIIGTGQSLSASSYGSSSDPKSRRVVQNMESSIGHVVLDQSRAGYASHQQRLDLVWRNLRRRERILEGEIQQLLDSQAAALMSGRQLDELRPSGNLDEHTGTGSSTPTRAFYSNTASSSKMPRTLHSPLRSTLDANVVPVRQPAKAGLPGLGAARNGLCTAMESLRELREEENEHIAAAIVERKSALQRLNSLGIKRLGILSELTTFDSDLEEPLARELREIGERRALVDQEISRLEEQLTGLRKQQIWLQDEMTGLQEKKEAGLSGYRGALRDVESELNMLVKRPPVLPLDPAIQDEADGTLHRDFASSAGPEFFSLHPGRRTPELAKTWWEAELAVLEKRSIRVQKDQQALDEGSALWRSVLSLVLSFEATLRETVESSPSSKLGSSTKGKDRAFTQEDSIRLQLGKLGDVLTELEQAKELAESNGWNLLICAIGAELEAFREARDILSTLLPQQNEKPSSFTETLQKGSRPASVSHDVVNVVDNEDVDFLQDPSKSQANNSTQRSTNLVTTAPVNQCEDNGYNRSRSQISENEVPLEFLAEHE